MQDNIRYYRKDNQIEYIYYHNAIQSYPIHTHANHITLGYILDGVVCITCGAEKNLYHTGESYCVLQDVPHALEPVDGRTYSMISMCISTDILSNESKVGTSYLQRLKQLISDRPENAFLIDDMAQSVSISPYHMIREFKNACGLTPHQFQIQCRVRKAQKLLGEGKSVTEAAFDTGFCDQSHFDRCFRKLVGLTPNAYKKSIEFL